MGRRSSRDCACRSVAALVLPLRRPTRRRYYPTTSPATIAHRRGLSWSSLGWFTLKPSGTTFLIRAVSPLLSFLLSSFSSPLPAHFFHSIFLSFFSFFSPVIRHILYPCLLLIRTILPFFIFRRPFIFFSFKFSFKVSWSFDSLCFSFHVSSTLSCFALFTPFTLCLLISAFLFLFPS